MALINLSMEHRATPDEARAQLERAVLDVHARFGPLIRRTEWSADRSRVRLEGAGFWAEIRVDAREVHATGDVLGLGQLLGGGPIASGLKGILEKSFPKALPR